MLRQLRRELKIASDPAKAKILKRFFKTGFGQYGFGDIFLGITVPKSRQIAKCFSHLSLQGVEKLLVSKIHEERLIALLLLINSFIKGSEKEKEEIYNFYLRNTKYINNWDLVDLSADKIVGAYLANKPKDILLKLAKSENIWERRIAIIATFQFIKKHQASDWTLKIAEILLNDKHDLIQKAVGWMLREVGKKISQDIEEEFLKKHYQKMPRTMLRYAIERFPETLKKTYMS